MSILYLKNVKWFLIRKKRDDKLDKWSRNGLLKFRRPCRIERIITKFSKYSNQLILEKNIIVNKRTQDLPKNMG